MSQKIVGTFEKVNFPKFGINNIMAKVDTGAYTGALHCTKIEEIKTEEVEIKKIKTEEVE